MFKKLEDMYAWSALPLRLGLAAVFLFTGINKLMDIGGTSGFLEGLGFPAPMVFAIILTAAEVLGGAALLLGLYTRIAAMVLGVLLIVATVTAHLDPNQIPQIVRNAAYFGIVISLIFSGPGKWSLDEKFFLE